MSKAGFNILTQVEAIARAQSIRAGVQYDCFLNFHEGENFSGLVRIRFQLADTKNVFLDFAGHGVDSININGHNLENVADHFQNSRISFPEENLRIGHVNTIVVQFNNKYFTDGNGIQTYTDVDGSQYLYTQSEPFWGNRVYPMFDQPDLKGNITFFAAAPKKWQIITSEDVIHHHENFSSYAETNPTCCFQKRIIANFPQEGERSFWQFGTSICLSTYLYNIVCGPYKRIDLEESKRYNNIPMAIYCRESLHKFALEQAENIFSFHMRGIEFYGKAFDLPYPFSKCDVIFCPEYTVGAMEYPGSITYTERLLPREQNTKSMISLRGSVILHELAHMWFGNTVTMEWWEDLWLNESFADFV